MGRLEGKVAVITGATSGIGLATARLFAQEGASVFISGRRSDELKKAVKIVGKNVTPVQGDAADQTDLDRLFETVHRQAGCLDVFFACAGRGHEPIFKANLEQVTLDQFNQIFDLNVKGTLFAVQKALPFLTDGASVILNSSIIGTKGIPGSTVHSASKAAIRSFARTWAAELKDRRIRVNVVSPGPTNTPAMSQMPPEMQNYTERLIPRGELGRPEEIALAVLFLASADSSFSNGIELTVDGGMSQI